MRRLLPPALAILITAATAACSGSQAAAPATPPLSSASPSMTGDPIAAVCSAPALTKVLKAVGRYSDKSGVDRQLAVALPLHAAEDLRQAAANIVGPVRGAVDDAAYALNAYLMDVTEAGHARTVAKTAAALAGECGLQDTYEITVPPEQRPKPKPKREAKPKARPKPKPRRPSTDPAFGTCAAANRAGYGPYHRGSDPEYHWYEDRDGDGTVCER